VSGGGTGVGRGAPGAVAPGDAVGAVAPAAGAAGAAGIAGDAGAHDLDGLLACLPALRAEVRRALVGQEEVLEQLLTALLAGGHALLEGVPGLAKTLMVRTLGQALGLQTKRIQFTPDLMPSDILGTEVLEEDHATGRRAFRFQPGPVFTHLVLADEINRTPPKTQAALLEAMQEGEVSHGGVTRPLPRPFFVLATQNPIEQAGTYPLPEAQLDRFLLFIRVAYPSAEEEVRILAATTGAEAPRINAVCGAAELVALQGLVRQVHVAASLVEYAAALVRATRPAESPAAAVREAVEWGAGPRGGQALLLCAKARALLAGRLAVSLDDLRVLAAPVLRHRLVLTFGAQAERRATDEVIAEVLATVAPPRSPLA
jgi:MoxR-like ATPase